MPLPWKKVKSTRISQLVNDHFHKSQKRRDGSSLVVETGFPTSLVDLFIKNHEKLKKPSKKKRQSPPITPPSDVNDPIIAGSNTSFHSISPSHSPMISPLITVSPSRSPLVSPLRLPSEGVNGNLVAGLNDGLDESECVAATGVDANTVLLVVLKMFLVVVLALWTMRLTVGITISAFLLFFLEYAGKHASAVLKPCSQAIGVLKSMVINFKEFNHLLKHGSSLKNHGSRYEDQEIQIVESNRYLVNHVVDEIQPEDEIIEGSCYKRSFEYQEIESKEVVMIEKEESSTCEVVELKKKSRKAKIKSKMKEFVSKKLRSSRKEHESQSVEIVKEDYSVFLRDERVVQCKDEMESDGASELSSVSGRRYKEDDNMSGISAFVRLSDVSDETDTKREEKRGEIEGGLNWRYLVLCVIVLAGLIGGRAFGVLLTLSWFLLLKLGGKLPRYMKVPIIEPSN